MSTHFPLLVLLLTATVATISLELIAPENVLAQSRTRNNTTNNTKAPKEPWARRYSVDWTSAPLRTTLGRFAKTGGFDLVVDRRVDPMIQINHSARHDPAGKILYEAVASVDCGIVWLDKIAYVARREDAARLLVAYDALNTKLRSMPTSIKRKLLNSTTIEWPRLTTPAQVFDSVKKQLPLNVSKVELPHDLLPAVSIRSARKIDQLILLTYGFNLWPTVAKDSITFTSLPIASASTYSLRLPRKRAAKTSEIQLRRITGDSELKLEKQSSGSLVTAQILTLLRVKQVIDTAAWESMSKRPSGDEEGLFTLRSKQQIGAIVNTAAKKLDLELQYAPELRELLIRRIDINVSAVTAEQLVQAALVGTGLTYRIADKQLIIERE